MEKATCKGNDVFDFDSSDSDIVLSKSEISKKLHPKRPREAPDLKSSRNVEGDSAIRKVTVGANQESEKENRLLKRKVDSSHTGEDLSLIDTPCDNAVRTFEIAQGENLGSSERSVSKRQKQRRVVYMYSDDLLSHCDKILKILGRASLVHRLVEAYSLLNYVRVVDFEKASEDELKRFHTTDYIDCLKESNNRDDDEDLDDRLEEYGLSYDCPMFKGVYDTVCYVAGASLKAADCLMNGTCEVAINWFGGWHHAKKDSASGFCYVNDIVLAILRLCEKYNRVMYIDLDLHHGDGVEDAFCTTQKVLTVSFHKYAAGFFPGTGRIKEVGVMKGKYYSVNVPLWDGINDRQFVSIVCSLLSKLKEKFNPQAVVCQCGADGIAGDPMDSFNLTHLSLSQCVHYILQWQLPILMLGGGGYHYQNTARCWTYLTALVAGKKLPVDIPDHCFLMEYGPSYEITVTPGNRKNNYSKEYLEGIVTKIKDNISHITS